MLAIASLAAIMGFQDPAPEIFCVADALGVIGKVVAQEGSDGSWRTLGSDPLTFDAASLPGAHDAPWYTSRAEIEWGGRRYAPAPAPEQVSAVGRYLRHQGVMGGVPIYSLWPGGDRDLAVLVEARGCLFHIYSPVEAAVRPDSYRAD